MYALPVGVPIVSNADVGLDDDLRCCGERAYGDDRYDESLNRSGPPDDDS